MNERKISVRRLGWDETIGIGDVYINSEKSKTPLMIIESLWGKTVTGFRRTMSNPDAEVYRLGELI